ncbi:hypothetical protein ACFWGN_21445 [Oerskovia sp. NPDC060338]|uniref:hypothetical protein n=1 Tax=Oerskovia sp. NPDC060338 TaxID=3347100 RepID=UPI003660C936
MFSIDQLTLGEIATVEELSGESITSFGNGDKPMAKSLQALYFVAKRREDRKFTFKEAENVTMQEATDYLGFGETADPKE